MNYFVTAINTDSGKTFVSAILCEALNADYWKPIQAGLPRDSDVVHSLMSNPANRIHTETYLLKTPASPHASAKIDGVKISLKNFVLPDTKNPLIIEGAGGCLVPLNENDFVIDLIQHLRTPVILVADLYLGSINHTLLTIEALSKRKIRVHGIIFNGEENIESESIIAKHSGLRVLLKISKEKNIDQETVKKYAIMLKKSF
jgi:dethiobiotin synthetase